MPPPLHGAVDRAVLVRRLLAPDFPCLLVEAPAGYGKTTILAQAHREAHLMGWVPTWLTVAGDSGELSALVADLAGAIAGAAGVAVPAGPPVIASIAEILNAVGKPVLVIVDDADRSIDMVMRMVESLVPGTRGQARFIVATRFHPSAGLARLLSAGDLDILDRTDLSLTTAEARQILGGDVGAGDVQLIIERTEGWPVMIQLVRLSLRRNTMAWRGFSNFSGNTTELADYLSEQLIGDVDTATRDVMVKISICERFDGDLLNMLCARTDGWALIDDLVRQGQLIAQLDSDGSWYRFHPLLAEFLVARLRRHGEHVVAALHREAARWFAHAGHLEDAVRHAYASGDTDFTTRLLANSGGWLTAFRGGTKLLKIMAGLPEAILRANPYLRLGQIYLLAQESRLKEARTALDTLVLERPTDGFEDRGEGALFHVSASALDALLCVYEVKRIDASRLRALRSHGIRPLPPALAAMITHLLGFAYYCEGNFPEARRTLPAAADQCLAAGSDFVAGYSFLALGDTHLEMGETEEASLSFMRAVDIAKHRFGPDSNQVLAANIFLAEVAHDRGEFDRAGQMIDGMIDNIERRDPWFSLYMSAYRIAAATIERRSSWSVAVEFLDRAAARLERHEMLAAYAPYLAIRKAEILTRAGQSDAAAKLLLANDPDRLESGISPQHRIRTLWSITSARLAIMMGKTDDALVNLRAMIPQLLRWRQVRPLIKAYSLSAAAEYQSGSDRMAAKLLGQAVALAKPGRMLGPILEEQRLLRDKFDEAIAGFASAEPSGPATSEKPKQPRVHQDIGLSPREYQILSLLADGLASKEMAVSMNLSVSTVQSYRKSVYKKMGASSRSQAIKIGKSAGML